MIMIFEKITSFFLNKRKPQNPNEFVRKFVKDSNAKRVQLEMIYDNKIILQVDALKFVSSWFKITSKNIEPFKDGFVIFFTTDKKEFQKVFSKKFTEFSKKEKEILKIEEFYEKKPVITLAKFVKKTENHIDLADEMRRFIDRFYFFEEANPSIIFNLRYIENYSG